MPELTAIVASHYPNYRQFIPYILEKEGYSLEVVDNEAALLEKIENKDYDVYVIEINLGYSGIPAIEPLMNVWEKIGKRVKKQEAKLIAFASSDDTLNAAKEYLEMDVYKSPAFIGQIPDLVIS